MRRQIAAQSVQLPAAVTQQQHGAPRRRAVIFTPQRMDGHGADLDGDHLLAVTRTCLQDFRAGRLRGQTVHQQHQQRGQQ